MPIEEAAAFFEAIPAIHRHLKTLTDVGLGYVRLGQPAPTLSGGEAQRVKLASELQRRSTGRTIYVLDEPTTGLHFEDIRKLLGVLGRLVNGGNTVIVIEHNLDVIKTADHVIDLGPDGGSRGGHIIATGTPEHIAAVQASHTGAVPGRHSSARAGRPRPPPPDRSPAPGNTPGGLAVVGGARHREAGPADNTGRTFQLRLHTQERRIPANWPARYLPARVATSMGLATDMSADSER